MSDLVVAFVAGWLAPFAVFGLYSLVHLCRPRRPIAAPNKPAAADFFVEAARDGR